MTETTDEAAETVELRKSVLHRVLNRLDELETEVAEYRDENERDKATIRKDVHEAIEKVEEATAQKPAQSEDENDDEDERSPLAQLIDLPVERAKEALTANQERARLAAQRAPELGKKTKAGLVVKSRDIADYLKQRGVNAHTETISRVMDYIADLGKSDVSSRIHKGDRILVFNPERVKEYGSGEEPEKVVSRRDLIPPRSSGEDPPAT